MGPRPKREERATSSWASTIWRATWPAIRILGQRPGRVANRVAKGQFTLDGKEYKLAVNNGPNSLHGGLKGFDKKVWKAEEASGPAGPAVKLTYISPDGEEGYPGNLTATVTYTVTADKELKIDYTAVTDKATPVNLTNHSYFNLGGPETGDILGHELTLLAEEFTPADETLIPTGKLAPVKGTPLDFTSPTPIGHGSTSSRAIRSATTTTTCCTGMARRRHWERGCLIPGAGGCSRCSRPSRACSSTRRTFWTGSSREKGASSTRSITRFAWRPSIFPTRCTTTTFRRRSCGRAKSIRKRRFTSSPRDEIDLRAARRDS